MGNGGGSGRRGRGDQLEKEAKFPLIFSLDGRKRRGGEGEGNGREGAKIRLPAMSFLLVLEVVVRVGEEEANASCLNEMPKGRLGAKSHQHQPQDRCSSTMAVDTSDPKKSTQPAVVSPANS
eukprot:757890-Hanusia_phi.AAC.5